jgi:hypothetical protein
MSSHACPQQASVNILLLFGVLCYADDFNRVVLKEIPEVEHSDYINASYVDVNNNHSFFM